MKKKFIIMHENDNCATMLENIRKNEEVMIQNNSIKINHNIPLGHKIALKTIKKGEKIIKYGEIIGLATDDITTGDWIHTHNIKSYYMEGIER
jgi:altronate dehydratase